MFGIKTDIKEMTGLTSIINNKSDTTIARETQEILKCTNYVKPLRFDEAINVEIQDLKRRVSELESKLQGDGK